MKKSIAKIQVRFQSKVYTSRAGLKPLSRFAGWFGMRKVIESHLVLPKRERKFTSTDLICAHLAMRCAGVRRISHRGQIAGDPLVLELAGVEEFPSEDSLYDTLHLFAPGEEMLDEEGIRRLASLVDIHEGFVKKFFEKSPQWKRRAQRVLTVDVDSHVQTVYGQQEGAALGYNPKKRGRLSYHPLVATISEIRMPLAGLFWGHQSAVGREIVEFFQMVKGVIKAAGLNPRVIQFRGDAGTACDELLAECESAGNVRYAFSVAINKAFQRKVWGLRYKEVAAGICVSEFWYGGKGTHWSRSRRVVVVRQSIKQLGDKAQGKLFGDLPGYRYQLIVTNKRSSCQAVWRFYNGRADSENVIKDLVEGVGLDAIPTGRFLANAANFWLMLIAQTLLSAYRALVVKAVTKTIPMVRTLWERFLYWGGQIVRHGRVIYLDMARGSPEAARFLALWQRMDALGIP